MKIYLDLFFFINFFFDYLLLITVNKILKRNAKKKRIFLGALIGSLSTFFLFFSFDSIELFLFKVFLSVLMILISFSHHSFRDTVINLAYLYFVSILLGGFLYYLNLEFSYDVIRSIFVKKGNSRNLLFLCPTILYIYVKQSAYQKRRNANLYCIELVSGRRRYQYTGYLDTGNRLYDPYTKRPVHLLYDPSYQPSKKQKVLYVPYHGVGGSGILPCVFFYNIIIDKKK